MVCGPLELSRMRWGIERLRQVVRYLGALSPASWSERDKSGSPLTERALVNRRAEDLLDRYGNTVLRCACACLHDRGEAEGVLQETMIRYLTTAPEFANPEHEKAWLLKVAMNLCKNRLAYLGVRRTDELREDLAAEQREDLSFVWDAVGRLPRHLRAAIHLFYYEGCSTGEIAAILGRRESTVRSDLHRGRARLREILREVYDFDGTV